MQRTTKVFRALQESWRESHKSADVRAARAHHFMTGMLLRQLLPPSESGALTLNRDLLDRLLTLSERFGMEGIEALLLSSMSAFGRFEQADFLLTRITDLLDMRPLRGARGTGQMNFLDATTGMLSAFPAAWLDRPDVMENLRQRGGDLLGPTIRKGWQRDVMSQMRPTGDQRIQANGDCTFGWALAGTAVGGASGGLVASTVLGIAMIGSGGTVAVAAGVGVIVGGVFGGAGIGTSLGALYADTDNGKAVCGGAVNVSEEEYDRAVGRDEETTAPTAEESSESVEGEESVKGEEVDFSDLNYTPSNDAQTEGEVEESGSGDIVVESADSAGCIASPELLVAPAGLDMGRMWQQIARARKVGMVAMTPDGSAIEPIDVITTRVVPGVQVHSDPGVPGNPTGLQTLPTGELLEELRRRRREWVTNPPDLGGPEHGPDQWTRWGQ